jgi:hypothetical protein
MVSQIEINTLKFNSAITRLAINLQLSDSVNRNNEPSKRGKRIDELYSPVIRGEIDTTRPMNADKYLDILDFLNQHINEEIIEFSKEKKNNIPPINYKGIGETEIKDFIKDFNNFNDTVRVKSITDILNNYSEIISLLVHIKRHKEGDNFKITRPPQRKEHRKRIRLIQSKILINGENTHKLQESNKNNESSNSKTKKTDTNLIIVSSVLGSVILMCLASIFHLNKNQKNKKN